MNNKFSIILRNHLINTYKLKILKKSKIILILILVIYILGSFFMMLSQFFKDIYETLAIVNLNHYYLTIIFSITSVFSLIFTIFSAKNALFENKDNDLLFSLPITKKTILLSRVTSILIYNFALSLLIIIPGIYVFYLKDSITVSTSLIIILLTLFSSIIPTILSSLFGYVIALITSKSKNKNVIELISYIIFISIYMLIVYNGKSLLNLFIHNPVLLKNVLKYIFFPIYLINLCITKLNLFYIILYIFINIGILYSFITLFNKLYYKIIVNLKNEKTSSNFKIQKTKYHSKIMTLIQKEIRRYFSSAIYVFNTSFGIIFLLIISIASLFYKSDELLAMISDNLAIDSFMLVFYLLLFVIGFSVTTNSSISIERNNFWILKMLPLSPREVFMAKKSVNIFLLIPIIILSLIIFKVGGYITLEEMIFLLLINNLFSLTIANFGLICNLIFPKFDAPNDTVIVKQSMSAMLGIMIPLIFLIFYIMLLNTFNLTTSLILRITFLVFTFLFIFTNIILNTWGIKKYKSLS